MNAKLFLNEYFHINNFEILNEESQKAKKILEEQANLWYVKDLIDTYPIIFKGSILTILCPTYKVWILNQHDFEDNDIVLLLRDIKHIYIDRELNVENTFYGRIHPITIHCQKDNLSDNAKLEEKIEKILASNNIECTKCIDVCCINMRVKLDEDGKIKKVEMLHSEIEKV